MPCNHNLIAIIREKALTLSSASSRRSRDPSPAFEYQDSLSSSDNWHRPSSQSDNSHRNSVDRPKLLAPPKDQNYESGFASASSVEENSFSIASRRRRPIVEPMVAKVDPWRIEDDGTDILDMSAGERCIWVISALWASWRLLNVKEVISDDTAIHLSRTLVVFTCVAFFATLFSFRSKPKTASDVSSSCSSDDADGDVNIEKVADSPRRRRPNEAKMMNGRDGSEKVTKIRDTRIGRSRLFGKSRASFRLVD